MKQETLQDFWRQYRDAAYPGGMPAELNQQVHQGFFAGLMIAFEEAGKLAPLSKEEALLALHKLFLEAEEICRANVRGGQ